MQTCCSPLHAFFRFDTRFLLVLALSLLNASCADMPQSRPLRVITLDSLSVVRGVGDSIDLLGRRPALSAQGFIAVQLMEPPSGGVAVYDSAGGLIKRVTRPGGGPGEVRNVLSAGFGPGDTLWVLDQYVKLHVFTPPPDLSFVRTVSLARPVEASITQAGIVVPGLRRNNKYSPPELRGWDGSVQAQFGSTAGLAPEQIHMGAVHLVDSSRLWSASTELYAIDELGWNGAGGRRITRNVEWFSDATRSTRMPWEERPSPRIVSITEDTEGRLWVLVRRAHRDWQPDMTLSSTSNRPLALNKVPSWFEVSRFFESVVEVFDAESGMLLATRTLDGTVFSFVSPGVLCAVNETANGSVSLHLLSVGLEWDTEQRH